jgi:L-2-aminoadipate reductase
MVPVDHVARIVTASALHSVGSSMAVVHSTGHPRSRFIEMLSCLSDYGFSVKLTNYVPWRIALERYTVLESKDNALYPLLHFVLDNLPQSTKAPELDDRNARAVLTSDIEWTREDLSQGKGVGPQEMGLYLAYLVGIGFLDPPSALGRAPLPKVQIDPRTLEKLTRVGGRGSRNSA